MAPRDPERTFIELLFASSRKYAAWDPEVEVRVGDYGIITRGERPSFLKFWARNRRQGIFLKQGNIYDNGKAKKFEVPPPKTYEHEGSSGVSWIVSQNASETGLSADVSACVPFACFPLLYFSPGRSPRPSPCPTLLTLIPLVSAVGLTL